MGWSAKPNGGYDRTSQEAIGNALEIYAIYHSLGWSDNAIYTMIGCFQAECDLNPWQWENGIPTRSSASSYPDGYGLPQFTPANVYLNGGSTYNGYAPNYSDYPGSPSDGMAQTLFMNDHMPTDWLHGTSFSYYYDAFIALSPPVDITTGWNLTFEQFKSNTTDSLKDLTVAYEVNYLRPSASAAAGRFYSAYYDNVEYWANYFSANPPVPFTPRLSLAHPAPSPWYTPPGNWFAANGFAPDYGITYPNGNCTWYAYGRYAEVRNAFANLPLGDAGTWYENATAFERGDFSAGAQPRLGAIICFKASSGSAPGHLTVVEQINPDGTIVVSNSGYTPGGGNTYFWTATVSRDNQYREGWYESRNYYCQGFIYNDAVVPPTPPPPPSSKHKMPLWMMLRHNY